MLRKHWLWEGQVVTVTQPDDFDAVAGDHVEEEGYQVPEVGPEPATRFAQTVVLNLLKSACASVRLK